QQGLSRVSSAVGAEVVAALTQLGWDEATAQEAVSQVESQADDASSLLRLSLQTLGRRRG
ncbi:RuvA C-terminal domain-containing protein, partial [Aerococcus urinae]